MLKVRNRAYIFGQDCSLEDSSITHLEALPVLDVDVSFQAADTIGPPPRDNNAS